MRKETEGKHGMNVDIPRTGDQKRDHSRSAQPRYASFGEENHAEKRSEEGRRKRGGIHVVEEIGIEMLWRREGRTL